MANAQIPAQIPSFSGSDVTFAIGIIMVLSLLFLPIPVFLIDLGLAVSLAFSVLILMVALWIPRPLDFSSFPTILLISTMLRLSLNIATTRMILSEGHGGVDAAGNVIAGFSRFVMSGDFVIGLVVFLILVVVNFVVITKGSTRIAEVGARFTLDAIPGKQMSIDADLSAGTIDDAEARRRRKELEEESSFYGSMDGASKFVRGDAIAGLIITFINIVGGIVIGYTRHGMSMGEAADVFTKLSVGDGLVSQIPALIVSLAAGLLVSKGGNQGSADKIVFDQLGNYPRALYVAAGLLLILAFMPGLPALPFLMLSVAMATVAYMRPLFRAAAEEEERKAEQARQQAQERESRDSVKSSLAVPEIQLCLGKQLATQLVPKQQDMAHRMKQMRKRFAAEYGFVVPEVQLVDEYDMPPKAYRIKIYGTSVAEHEMRLGELLAFAEPAEIMGIPNTAVREPAFGGEALSVMETFRDDLRRMNVPVADSVSVILTHLSEVVRNNLPQLFSYKAMKTLINDMEPEYRKLADEICTTHATYPGLQAVLKLLLAERVSIRNLPLIIEAVAEIAPTTRKSEAIVEHVRSRMSQQLCGDLTVDGVLHIIRLGNRWELALREGLKRDAAGEIVQFDIDPRQLEELGAALGKEIGEKKQRHEKVAIVTTPEARPYVRMIVERMHPDVSVLSHLEIGKGIEIRIVGTLP
ncbi:MULTISPECIES: flagellar biosynthesis protein FlhA [unclassified Roseitalea]|uniref:flagellar biosynthesis protein FlhA n=1 Tax=unclassified Roseitalea TaxID=2639107 RepID=UPI00273F81A7|nr:MULTISPECIES: flagellar biosynthesis protein FlhA [unclassified Roseitalea]